MTTLNCVTGRESNLVRLLDTARAVRAEFRLALARRETYHQSRRALSALSDRILDDIGILRADIDQRARDAANRAMAREGGAR